MATQRVTIAKIGGLSAQAVLLRLREWSEARRADDPDEWSGEQWPAEIRFRADAFADRLRSHALTPPVVYFVEWSDFWSSGYLYSDWLTPPDAEAPLIIHGDHYEIYGYGLPDGDRLAARLRDAGLNQSWAQESDWYASKLSEAVAAWQPLVSTAVLVVLREVSGGLVTDDELVASLERVPDWLSEG